MKGGEARRTMVEAREVRATLLGASVLSIYVALVLMSGRVDFGQFTTLFLTYLGGSIGLWFVLGVICMFVAIYRAARRSGGDTFLVSLVSDTIRDRWNRDRGASLIWPPLMFATLIAAFNAFKQMVLPLAGYRFDPLFAKADRLLFLGTDGWRVTHAVLGSPQATLMVDRLYHGWFVPMALGVIVCSWLPASTYRLRTQYLLSYLAVWILIGSVLAFLLPSAGPCFYERLVGPSPGFDALMQRLGEIQAVNGSPLLALHNQAVLLHVHFSDRLALGGGISAMPSVHNALAVLFALAIGRVSRTLGWVFALYALAIWVGSIHLGWHYAVDGIVAAVLTVGIWRACGWIAERLDRPLLARPTVAAMA